MTHTSRLFCIFASIGALLTGGCRPGQHQIVPIPAPALESRSVLPDALTFAEYRPPANGITSGIAFGADDAVWFTQNNSYVGRFYNGAFSDVLVRINVDNYTQGPALPILTALSSGVYGGIAYQEQTGFAVSDDIYKINYAGHVSLTNGQQAGMPNPGTMQGIAAGPSAAYATGSFIQAGIPCDTCLYVISSTGGDATRSQDNEAGEAIAYVGGYVYVAADENYGGPSHGIKLYRLNASLSSFTQVASLPAPSHIHFMTAGPDGALWFTDNGRNTIGRYASAHVTEYALPIRNENPEGIVRGLDGALWFTEAQTNRLGRITTTGVITEFNLPFAGGKPTGLVAATTSRTLWYTDIGTGKLGRVSY